MYIFKWYHTYFFTWLQYQKMRTNQKTRVPVNADVPETNKKCNESPHFSQGTVGAVRILHVQGPYVWLNMRFPIRPFRTNLTNRTFRKYMKCSHILRNSGTGPRSKWHVCCVKHGMISTVKCDISTSVLVQTLGQNPDICCVHSGYFSICFCLRSNLVEHPGLCFGQRPRWPTFAALMWAPRADFNTDMRRRQGGSCKAKESGRR